MLMRWVYSAAQALAEGVGPARCPWCERPAPAPCPACVAGLPWNRAREDLDSGPGWAPFEYAEPVAHKIRALKFGGDLAAARILGEVMADAVLAQGLALPDLLVPVPLHPARLRRRGYNQAVELGRVLARRLNVPLAPACARRVRATEEQTHLGARARRANVRGAFHIGPAARGRHLALLDDVITTGATAAEFAHAARTAGAAGVQVWAVARTV